MRKKLALFFTLVFLPNLASADISFEINNLLQNIFGQRKTVNQPKPIEIPKIILPENPDAADLANFKDKIHEEEIQLKQFESQKLDTEAALYEIEQQKNQLANSIFSLDTELALIQQNLDRLAHQEQVWQDRLTQETKTADNLKIQIRVKNEELNKKLNKNFIQSEALGIQEEIPLFEWLFSDKKVSEIIEEERQRKLDFRTGFIRIKQLEDQFNTFSTRSKKSADFLEKIKNLKHSFDRQKQTLLALTSGQSADLKELETKSIVHQNTLQNYRQREEESLAFLISLKKNADIIAASLEQKDSEDKATEAPESQGVIPNLKDFFLGNTSQEWIAPLEIPLNISAKFKDPIYEVQFDRPHLGVDFEAPQGTKIRAPKAGNVIKAADNGFEYSYLILDHGDQVYTLYGHVSSILVTEGQAVRQSDLIALTGGTPKTKGAGHFSTGPHLHLEAFVRDEHVDPVVLLELE